MIGLNFAKAGDLMSHAEMSREFSLWGPMPENDPNSKRLSA
jgi:hypothetical protein